MADWTQVFRSLLNEHKDVFVAAKGNPTARGEILKTIKDVMLNGDKAKDPCIMLPKKNIRKVSSAIFHYVHRLIHNSNSTGNSYLLPSFPG
jgi:hypothetical protein